MVLLEQNSPCDLVLRGFCQADILNMIGVDVGYHGNSVKRQLMGIDRFEYKVTYVKCHCDDAMIRNVLNEYATGLDKESVLRRLGIAGQNIVKLYKLFDALGYASEFREADKQQRLHSMRSGTLSKYGVSNVFELPEIQSRATKTREEKYGAPYTLCSKSSLREQARKTQAEHMLDSAFVASVVDKRKSTMLARYGVEHSAQSVLIQEKTRKTIMERYGVPHHSQLPERVEQQRYRSTVNAKELQSKARATCMKKYGVPYWGQTDFARKVVSDRMSSADVQAQSIATKRANGTLNSSKPESLLYELLVQYFGECDVVSQYRDDRYPFACDFYISSRDLFIELNGLWTHGGHWFDAVTDADKLQSWAKKNTKYYDVAIRVWSECDVHKRTVAFENKLNYVVFWDCKLRDANLWFQLGCPDGADWLREYSWVPNDMM